MTDDKPPRAVCTKGGPNLVYGIRKIEHADGSVEIVERDPVALCACGKSKRKPYCDSSHKNPLTDF